MRSVSCSPSSAVGDRLSTLLVFGTSVEEECPCNVAVSEGGRVKRRYEGWLAGMEGGARWLISSCAAAEDLVFWCIYPEGLLGVSFLSC